jgi:hypothetical protein
MDTESKKPISACVFDEIQRQTIEREQEAVYQDPDDLPAIPQHRRTSEDSILAKRITHRLERIKLEDQ